MIHRVLIAFAAALFVLSLASVFLVQGCSHSDTRADIPRPSAIDHPPIIGFAFSMKNEKDVEPYLRAIDELADAGFNSIEIVTPAFQENTSSTSIRINNPPGAEWDVKVAKREHLVAMLRRAKERGLRAYLMPIVLLAHPRNNEWRGKISPENWNLWWDSYNQMIDYFTEIANDGEAYAMSIGSELLSTEKNEKRWLNVIARVRQRFPGRLYYSTNWDHYHVPTFWKHLDYIGVSCYWDMTKGTDTERPTDAQLDARWAGIRKQIEKFAELQGRPIIFTEIGYPSLPWGLKDPWNYVNSKNTKADHQTQAAGYAAFLRAWGDLLDRPVGADNKPLPRPPAQDTHPKATTPTFTGVFFYEWKYDSSASNEDTGYGIKGKPAYELLETWLSPAAQPGASTQPSNR